MYNDFIKAIDSSSTIAIISHINPDGDTCGSALALYRALSLYSDKQLYLLCDGNIKGNLTTLKGSELYNADEPERVDMAIACDCADIDRLGKFTSLFKRAKINADIDHHKTNDKYGKINIIEPGVSATCEVMYKVIKELDKIKPCLDDDVARLLYSGLVTDSGGFTYSSVSTQTHKIASELIKYDIHASEVCERFLKKVSMNKFLLRMRVLSKAKFFQDDKIGMIVFSQEDFQATGTTLESTEGAINYIRDIDGVEIAVSITQMPQPNDFKISVRTSDNVDASRITMIFGGGGHKNAAGCRVSGFFEDVKDRLLKACADEL